MLPNDTKETPWWAWVVAVVVVTASAMVVPDKASYHQQIAQNDQ